MSTRLLEQAGCVNETVSAISLIYNRFATTECVDGVRESIKSISVIERLSTEKTVKWLITLPRSTVINVFIRLDYPDEFLTRVVEGKFNLVGRRTNRFITSELELFN